MSNKELFTDLVRKHAGVEDKFRDNIISEEVERKEVSGEDIKKMKEKIEAYAEKIDKLREEGNELADEINSFRTKRGGFAFKGTQKGMSAIGSLRGIYGDIRGMYMKGTANLDQIEKWEDK